MGYKSESNIISRLFNFYNLTSWYQTNESDDLPLDFNTRKRLANNKFKKYSWIPKVLARMLRNRLPKSSKVEEEDLYQVGMLELNNQINRLYGIEGRKDIGNTPEYKRLFRSIYDPKKKDLTIGPFLLKGMNSSKGELSPYINGKEASSLKYIKLAMLEEMRQWDPATPKERQQIKKVNKAYDEYFKATGTIPTNQQLSKMTGLRVSTIRKAKANDNAFKTAATLDSLGIS